MRRRSLDLREAVDITTVSHEDRRGDDDAAWPNMPRGKPGEFFDVDFRPARVRSSDLTHGNSDVGLDTRVRTRDSTATPGQPISRPVRAGLPPRVRLQADSRHHHPAIGMSDWKAIRCRGGTTPGSPRIGNPRSPRAGRRSARTSRTRPERPRPRQRRGWTG